MNSRAMVLLMAALLGQNILEAQTPSCAPAPAGLSHWWPAEGEARDAVGGTDGTLVNGVNFTAGKVGQAFNFESTNQAINFGANAGNFGTNDFSLEFWYRSTNTTRNVTVLGKRPTCGAPTYWEVHQNSAGFISFDSRDNNPPLYFWVRPTNAVNDGLDHHLAFTREGTNFGVFIDGALAGADATPYLFNFVNAGNLTLGNGPCSGVDGSYPFAGQLDEIGLYDRALAAADIAALFAAGAAGKCPTTPPPIGAFQNGSFELPGGLATNAVLSLTNGDTRLTGWRVALNGGAVGYAHCWANFAPAEGRYHVLFNIGNQPSGASLSQTFATVIGQRYVVNFRIGRTGPGTASVWVKLTDADGGLLASNTFTRPLNGYGAVERLEFVASTTATTVEFKDTSLGTIGIDLALDDVRVTEATAPPIADAFQNGSFELPGGLATNAVLSLTNGDTRLNGWRVALNGGTVGYAQGWTSFAPADGGYHLLFNIGNQPSGASLSQTFATAAGQRYAVSFRIGRTGPGTASMLVALTDAGGGLLASNTFLRSVIGYSDDLVLEFTAGSAATTVEFKDTSLVTDGIDLALDHVRVTEVTTPPPGGRVPEWQLRTAWRFRHQHGVIVN